MTNESGFDADHALISCVYNMQYSSHLLLGTLLFIHTATLGSCWQFFTSIVDYTLQNSEKDPEHIHSEYFYGDCKRQSKIYYTHIHLDHMDTLGKIIIRGWIDIIRIPTCILLRGMAFDYDLFRSTAFMFQICVPRITYCHTHKRFKYHYYEWYLPHDMLGGMNWDIYMFGPPNLEWQ